MVHQLSVALVPRVIIAQAISTIAHNSNVRSILLHKETPAPSLNVYACLAICLSMALRFSMVLVVFYALQMSYVLAASLANVAPIRRLWV